MKYVKGLNKLFVGFATGAAQVFDFGTTNLGGQDKPATGTSPTFNGVEATPVTGFLQTGATTSTKVAVISATAAAFIPKVYDFSSTSPLSALPAPDAFTIIDGSVQSLINNEDNPSTPTYTVSQNSATAASKGAFGVTNGLVRGAANSGTGGTAQFQGTILVKADANIIMAAGADITTGASVYVLGPPSGTTYAGIANTAVHPVKTVTGLTIKSMITMLVAESTTNTFKNLNTGAGMVVCGLSDGTVAWILPVNTGGVVAPVGQTFVHSTTATVLVQALTQLRISGWIVSGGSDGTIQVFNPYVTATPTTAAVAKISYGVVFATGGVTALETITTTTGLANTKEVFVAAGGSGTTLKYFDLTGFTSF